MLLVLAVLFTAVFLAARNIRSGSGDRKGAFKTGLAVFLLLLAGIFLGMHHIAGYSEVDRLFHVLRESSYRALTIWVTCLALEPIVRRNMPDLIVSWNRLLAGEWRDSLVGRDVLLGSLAGLAHASLIWLGRLANQLLYGWKGVSVMSADESLGGTRAVIASMLTRAGYGIGQGLLFVCFRAILCLVFRRRSYAAAGFFVIFSLIEMLFFARSPAYVVVTLVVSVLFLLPGVSSRPSGDPSPASRVRLGGEYGLHDETLGLVRQWDVRRDVPDPGASSLRSLFVDGEARAGRETAVCGLNPETAAEP